MSCEVPRRLVAQFYTFRVSADFVSLKGTSSFAQRCTELCSVRNVCRVGRIPAKLQSTTDNHTHTHHRTEDTISFRTLQANLHYYINVFAPIW